MGDATPAWQEIDRSTAAGRALWSIYGGDPSGRSAGNCFSAVNRGKEAAKPLRPLVDSAPQVRSSPQKAEVKVPKVGLRTSPIRRTASPTVRGKRGAAQILAEVRSNQEAFAAAPQPQPKGPCLDDKEKERLALKMEFDGQDPGLNMLTPSRRGGTRRDREQAELEDMFEDLMVEVQDCKARLGACDDGSSGWQLSTDAVQIKKELARRIDDMKRVDGLLSNC